MTAAGDGPNGVASPNRADLSGATHTTLWLDHLGWDMCPDGLAAIDAPWGVRAGCALRAEHQYRDRRGLRRLVLWNGD